MHIAQKFEFFLDKFRRDDGRRWNGQQLHDATGGVVTRSYVSLLRKGEFANPGVEKLAAIAKAMGFPPELWFRDIEEIKTQVPAPRARDMRATLAARVEWLFEIIPNDRTGEPYTNAEVARESLGALTEGDVEGIRTGRVPNPHFDQVLTLSEIFGVDTSYFTNRETPPPIIDDRILKALRDQKTHAMVNKSLDLSEGEKDLILNMLEGLGHLHRENGNAP